MNDTKPVIWNINASLYQSNQRVRALSHMVATLRRQLVAERKAYTHLHELVQEFTTRLTDYAESLSDASTTPNEKGATDI